MPSEQGWPYSLPELYTPDEVIVLQYIYCDESGKAPKDRFISCCGYVVDQQHIREFSYQWNAIAEQTWQVPPIHLREIRHPSESNGWLAVKNRWKDDWEDNCRAMLRDFSGLVQRSPISSWGTVLEVQGRPDAGLEAFRRLLAAVLQWLRLNGHDEHIGVVVDDDYEQAIQYHHWVRELRRDTQSALGRSIKSLCFSDDKGYPLLQAADMLAYFAREEKTQGDNADLEIYRSLTKTPICEDKIEFR